MRIRPVLATTLYAAAYLAGASFIVLYVLYDFASEPSKRG